MRTLLAIAVLLSATSGAQACMFVRNVPPEGWYEWSNALFAAEVTKLEQDAGKSVDIISVRIIETFKGPEGESATLRIPVRLRTACGLALPALGDRILVALNSNNDSSWAPLTAAYADQLRQHGKQR